MAEHFEYGIQHVDKSYRIFIPVGCLHRVAWITGDKPCQGWLLVGSPGRCRLFSATEVDQDAHLQSLRARINAELALQSTNSLDFQDETSLALALRLISVQITPPNPGWRLTLPRPIAAMMGIGPGDEVAVLFLQDHIEFWNIETLRQAVTTPLAQII